MLDPRAKTTACFDGSGVRYSYPCSKAKYLSTLPAGWRILAAAVAYLAQLALWVSVTAAADGVRNRSSNGVGATFYDVLGVSQWSNQPEIKRVFRRLAVRMHPDKLGPFEDEASERKANDAFVKILKAYETLGDPDLRRKYDQNGMNEEASEHVMEEDTGPRYEDAPFGMFVRFGGGRGGMWFRYKGHGQRRAPDIVYSHQISFEQAFVGVAINVTVTRERLCKACDATGSSKPEEMPTCPLCQGKGYAYHLFGVEAEQQPNERSNAVANKTRCSSSSHHNHHHHHHQHLHVHGDGSAARGSNRHRHCSAAGEGGVCGGCGDGESDDETAAREADEEIHIPEFVHVVNTTCKVAIPPGAPSGHTVTVNGKAHQYPGKLDGAVRVVAVLLPHPRFEREGANLVYEGKISLVDALLGFERKLTLLNGTRVPIVHDQVTLSGYSQEFPGLGFPVLGSKKEEYGSLMINFRVEFPPRLDAKHLEVLRDVLSEEEIAVLEDVLRLMRGSKDQEQPEMDPLEFQYSLYSSARKSEHYTCMPDLLWWTRNHHGRYGRPAGDADDDDDGVHVLLEDTWTRGAARTGVEYSDEEDSDIG